MKMVNGIYVTDDMHLSMKAICGRGGLVFLSAPCSDEKGNGCPNCNGSGNLMMQMATAGPSDTPPIGKWSHNGESNIWHNDKWYAVKTTVYDCPKCSQLRRTP